MEIKEIIRYELEGKEYNSLKHIKSAIENELGSMLDTLPVRLTPKQALDMLNIIVKNKARIAKLLTVTFEYGEDSLSGREQKNILDL